MNPKIFLKSILCFCFFTLTTELVLKAQTKEYSPAKFTDADREKKIAALYPLVESLYKDFAASNHIPGYSFGIVVDGKLVYSGAGGYIDIPNKFQLPQNPCFVSHL